MIVTRIKFADLVMVTLIFCSTIHFFVLDVGGILINLLDVVSVASILLMAPLVLRWKGPAGSLDVLGLVVWCLLASIFVGLSSLDSIRAFRDLAVVTCIYWMVSIYASDISRIFRLLGAIVAGSLLNAVVGIIQYHTGQFFVYLMESAVYKADVSGEVVERFASGFFPHPNGLGVLLIVPTILLIQLLLSGRVRFHAKILLLVLTATMLFAILFSYSKGAIFWIAVATLLSFWLRIVRGSYWAWCLLALVTAIALVVGYSYWRFDAGDPTVSTFMTRVFFWVASYQAFIDNWLLALVGGGGRDEMLFLTMQYSGYAHPNAHNTLLNIALLYGVPAGILFFATLIAALRRLSACMVTYPQNKALGIFLSTALVAYFGEMFFEPLAQGVVLLSQYFVLLALSIAFSRASALVGRTR